MSATMGNFFSGSGTWELAAKMCGAKVLWESEIEPFPIEIEKKRFPEAVQLGDITKVSGYDIEPVDIMTNSSPCQSISVAGKRHGMAEGSGTRSSLFYEVIRITKEMREKDGRTDGRSDDMVRPYVWLWENVPGLLSSAGGEDFRCAIEEIIKIKDPEVHIPMPPKGKWPPNGYVAGDGWSLAWCLRNAANEGVPQRRRRVFLAFSCTGAISAAEILFESESMSWNFEEIRKTWEDTSSSLGDRIEKAGRIIRDGYHP